MKKTIGNQVQVWLSIVTAVAAVVVGVWDALGDLPKGIGLQSITVAVLGLLIVWLMADHRLTARRLEQIEDLNLHSRLLGLSREALAKVDIALSNYVRIYAQWKFQKGSAPAAAEFIRDYMDQHYNMLQSLASRGRIHVPHRQSSHMQHLILYHMRSRFDAVSDRDLNFWLETQSSDYHKAIRSAHRRSQTIVNRIFIFSLHELKDRTDDICKVLRVQQQSGFGWGIAIWEEIDDHQRENSENVFDFAFSGIGGVLTYFQKDDRRARSLVVVLPVGDNSAEMQRQRGLYAHMVGECWLVNEQFKQTCAQILSKEQLQAAEKMARASNESVARLLDEHPDLKSERLIRESTLSGGSGAGREEGGAAAADSDDGPDFFLAVIANPAELEEHLHGLHRVVEALGSNEFTTA